MSGQAINLECPYCKGEGGLYGVSVCPAKFLPPLLHFEVPGPAVPKARARRGKGGHWYTPERTRAFETLVATLALAARQRLASWPLDARYRVQVAIPRESRGDVDNALKTLDGCNGILWNDDRQVDDARAFRYDGPAVCVQVEVLP